MTHHLRLLSPLLAVLAVPAASFCGGETGGKPLVTISEHAQGTTSLVFSPDGKVLAAGNNADGRVRFWEVATGKQFSSTLTHPVVHRDFSRDMKVAFSPDGTLLASIRNAIKDQPRLWDWRNEREVARLDELMLPAAVAFAPDGKLLAVVGAQHLVLFDVQRKATIHNLRHKDGGFVAWCAFSPDGKKLAVCGAWFRRLRIWDCVQGTEERVIHTDADRGCMMAVYWTKDGKSLIVVGPDNTACYWDVVTGQKYQQFGPVSGLDSPTLAVSPDETYVALPTRDKQLHLWEAATFKHAVFDNQWLPAFSPDGRLLATAVSGKGSSAITIWDFASLRKSLK